MKSRKFEMAILVAALSSTFSFAGNTLVCNRTADPISVAFGSKREVPSGPPFNDFDVVYKTWGWANLASGQCQPLGQATGVYVVGPRNTWSGKNPYYSFCIQYGNGFSFSTFQDAGSRGDCLKNGRAWVPMIEAKGQNINLTAG